jgi:hypothetical protein
MSDVDHSLRETLNSGASRILNAAEITRRLEEEARATGAPPPERLLFRHRALNRVVFVKRPKEYAPPPSSPLTTSAEILENGQLRTITLDSRVRVEKGDIATVVYVPYDADSIGDGGASFELGGRSRFQALLDATGFDARADSDAVRRDLRLLDLIEDLPSLDPFLLKDRVALEDMAVPEAYFSISETEFQDIKRYILNKFRPITERVVDPSAPNAAQTSEQFIMKLWEARDLDYLKPITDAFRVDPRQAGEIYYSWKGVTYYEFQYKRSQRTLLGFADWLHGKATPTDYVKPDLRQALAESARDVAGALARHLQNSSEILRLYNQGYEELFVRGGDARPFIDFLRDSSTLFWDIAASISALNHGVSVWEQRTRNAEDRRMTAETLKPLLDILGRVIV